MGHTRAQNVFVKILNCQSEVQIFKEKNEKHPKFTLTKDSVLYINILIFSESEEAVEADEDAYGEWEEKYEEIEEVEERLEELRK